MIKTNSDKLIESVQIGSTTLLFDGKGPRIFGAEESDIDSSVTWHEEKDSLVIHASVRNTNEHDVTIDRLGVYLGIDCYMEKFPEWNQKMFPTLLRCEKTHFYGYFMSPDGNILGITCDEPLMSYNLLYNKLDDGDFGHRIYSVELDIINAKRQPARHPKLDNILHAGECINRDIVLFLADNFDQLAKRTSKYTNAPFITSDKYTVEKGEHINISAINCSEIKIISPCGTTLKNGCEATECGVYTVLAKNGNKVSESKIYCRSSWDYYLKQARKNAVMMPQKATTHCESWYGLFSGYLAAKHYPDDTLDTQIDEKFCEIMPYMFDFDAGEPLVIPNRIQNTSAAISLLVDRYEANKAVNESSLDDAGRLADFLISTQEEDGAYYRDKTQHYTCVIYIAKSMLELYIAERDIPKYQSNADKHFKSVKAAIDNLVKMLDNIGTEGEQTLEDGMISCSALQIAMFALLLDKDEQKPYTDAAEYMIKKHECLEQRFVPDCRMSCCSLRYWEAQYDVLSFANMMNSPHGWTAWTLYAKYYLYLLTGKEHYLTDLMNGMGACVQLIGADGVLRWAFICDPCVDVSVFVKDKKLANGFSGKFEPETIGECYMPMISDWFCHNTQKLTGGYLKCPLILKDKTVHVDNQGGCCDNDVHEIFKCLEETVLEKSFVHRRENGELLLYSCHEKNGCIEIDSDTKTVIYNTPRDTAILFDGKKIVVSGIGTLTKE